MQLARDYCKLLQQPYLSWHLSPQYIRHPLLCLRQGMFPFAAGSQLSGMNAVTSLTAPWVRTASKELIGGATETRPPFRGAQIWRAWKPAGALAWWHGKATAPVDGWIDICVRLYSILVQHENIDSSSTKSIAFSHFLFSVSRESMQNIWPPIVAQSLCSIGISFKNYRCKGQFDIVSPADVCRAVCFRRIPEHMLFFNVFPTGHGLNVDVVLVHVQSDSTSLLRSWDVFLWGRILVFPVPTPALCNPLQSHNITRYNGYDGLCVCAVVLS